MKFLSTLAAAFMALRATTAVDATEHVERGLILGGTTVPIGKKLYAGGIRYASGNITFCGCVLISPIHVLTNAPCANPLNAKFVALGTHYNIGNRDGEELRVISAQNHTQYNPITGSFDLAILTLERPSKFASDSIKLPKHDDSDIVVGMQATNMGWGFTKDPDGEPSYELQSVSLPLAKIRVGATMEVP
ncbi:hypothetical protein PsorP6_015772 [Peronosclerospora sorghi]|uniref:Uncharacterized protein n=1 Tax=Peronosclerospora sorghi TaxID=230839 RepID=A0ACC0WN29_9STRA|nr:hypothetical protein PsorP6_015772 [Peronosclerospora sorghi]